MDKCLDLFKVRLGICLTIAAKLVILISMSKKPMCVFCQLSM